VQSADSYGSNGACVIEHNGYLLPSVISLQPIQLNSYFDFSFTFVLYVTSVAKTISGLSGLGNHQNYIWC
jgi:hypothetical protein